MLGLAQLAQLAKNHRNTATPHAYWRIYVNVVDGAVPSGVSFAELQFRATLEGGSLCVGGTPSASSNYDGTHSAAQGFDNDSTTIWASAAGVPQWLAYHLPTPSVVNQISIQAREDGGTYGQTPTGFTIQSSDDGITWNDEWSVNDSTGWAASEIRKFNRPSI